MGPYVMDENNQTLAVALLLEGETLKAAEKRARLMASAPNMVVALQAVENLLTREKPFGGPELTVLLHLVQRVKADAEGGGP